MILNKYNNLNKPNMYLTIFCCAPKKIYKHIKVQKEPWCIFVYLCTKYRNNVKTRNRNKILKIFWFL